MVPCDILLTKLALKSFEPLPWPQGQWFLIPIFQVRKQAKGDANVT